MIRRFLRNEHGGPTVETVIIFPILVVIFGMMLDVAMIFHGQAKTLRVVQDINREFSVGRIADAATTAAEIKTQLDAMKIYPTSVKTRVSSVGVAISQVEVPAANFTVIGYFNAFANDGENKRLRLVIGAEHLREHWES